METQAETPDHCSKEINEPCKLHPVDCPNCKNDPVCQAKHDMKAHPDKIKRCRFFRRKKGILG